MNSGLPREIREPGAERASGVPHLTDFHLYRLHAGIVRQEEL